MPSVADVHPTTKRPLVLDALRGFALLLGIILHAIVSSIPTPKRFRIPHHLRSLWLPCFLVVAGWVPSAYVQDEVSAPGHGGEAGPGPVFSDTGPDAAVYGAAAGYPVGTRTTINQLENLVGTYSHFGEAFPSRPIRRAPMPWLFKRAPEPTISYNLGAERLSIADYLRRTPVTGLLIAKDDTILYEHYHLHLTVSAARIGEQRLASAAS
jgi:hypothetical protein